MSNENTAQAHADTLKGVLEGEGCTVTRAISTEEGATFQLLLTPPSMPADLTAIAMSVALAGYEIAKAWQPAWLALRKCVVVTCVNPEFTEA